MTLEIELEGELDDTLQFVRSKQHSTKSLEATCALDIQGDWIEDEFLVEVQNTESRTYVTQGYIALPVAVEEAYQVVKSISFGRKPGALSNVESEHATDLVRISGGEACNLLQNCRWGFMGLHGTTTLEMRLRSYDGVKASCFHLKKQSGLFVYYRGGLIVKEAGKGQCILCMINEAKISGGLVGRLAGLRMESILETQSKQVLQDYAKEIVKEASRRQKAVASMGFFRRKINAMGRGDVLEMMDSMQRYLAGPHQLFGDVPSSVQSAKHTVINFSKKPMVRVTTAATVLSIGLIIARSKVKSPGKACSRVGIR